MNLFDKDNFDISIGGGFLKISVIFLLNLLSV